MQENLAMFSPGFVGESKISLIDGARSMEIACSNSNKFGWSALILAKDYKGGRTLDGLRFINNSYLVVGVQ